MLLEILIFAGQAFAGSSVGQTHIDRIDRMPDLPQPLQIIDYNKLAHDFDSKVYDFNQVGDHWPLVWWDRAGVNFPEPMVAMYTTIGDSRQGPKANNGQYHEAVAEIGSVLGASLVGIDKSSGLDYVGMLKNFFNRKTGWSIVQNNTNPAAGRAGGGYARDWWYDVYPNVLFYGVAAMYPHEAQFDQITHAIADRFLAAEQVLKGNYHYSYFDYGTLTPHTTDICPQDDVAAGHAYVLFNAYKKFGDARYLAAAKAALHSFDAQKTSPFYEVLMPFGAYLAARMNAEEGTTYNVAHLIDFSLDASPVCRQNWGAVVGRWNGFDVSGLIGSAVDNSEYAFLMNTYDMAWPLVPLVRYDQRFADAVGKWMLNAANAARLFYPDYSSAQHQTLKPLSSLTKGVIAYEGLAREAAYPEAKATTIAPVAQGDGPHWVTTNGPTTQFSIYGSAHVGIFGRIIQKTDVEGILKLDLLATDFFHDPAFPTWLIWNPYPVAKTISFASNADLYDAVSGHFLKAVVVPAHSSLVIVEVPKHATLTRVGTKLLANGKVIDYRTQTN